MDILIFITMSAVVLGSLYALLASGLSLIWSTLGVFNYAHGAVLILGAYIIWTFSVRMGWPVVVAMLVALPILAVIGVVVELFAVRPLLRRPNGTLLVMVSTLGIASAIEGLIQILWGPQSKQVPNPAPMTVPIAGFQVPLMVFVSLVLTFLLIGGLYALLTKTEWGWSILAVEQNREMAQLTGISPGRVYATVFAIATVLAGAAAIVYASTVAITPTKGSGPLLTAFVVLVFGGTASLWGTVLGAFVIGVLEATTTYFFGLQWSPIVVFLLLVLVMLIRPEGLVRGRKS